MCPPFLGNLTLRNGAERNYHEEVDGMTERYRTWRASTGNIPIWRRANVLFGDRPGLVLSLVMASVLAGLCESAVLALIASIATALVGRHSTVSFQVSALHVEARVGELLVVGLAIALARIAIQGLIAYLPALISAKVQAGLRLRLFGAFSRAPWSVQSADGEGKFQELATSQVIQATYGVTHATQGVTAGVMLLVLVGAALLVQFTTALVVIAAGLTLFLLFRPFQNIGSRRAQALSLAQLDYASGIHDAVSVAEETQVFGVSEAQERQISQLVDVARRRYFSTQFLSSLVPGAYQGLVLLLLVGGLAILEDTGNGHLASLGAVVLLLVRASSYGQQLQSNYQNLHQSLPFLDRLHDAERNYRAVPVIRGTRLTANLPRIAFDEVSYAYNPGRPVLRQVNFRIEPGEAIGVVGPSGAGKSTLVQLLLGIREPVSGRYLVDGEPAETWSPSWWSGAFAYVPQEPRLLQATVAENIRFLRQLDDSAVERAARLAHIDSEIMSWPNGYNTMISQRAKAVSGGQRQRICLARALAGNPIVLVLDEPTSALDPHSESLVQESLALLKGRLTLFVVAHRMSTLSLCDRVIVLKEGVLEAFASNDELERSNAFYRKAASLSQFNSIEISP